MLSKGMVWRRNVHRDTAEGIEDLAYPPTGGLPHLILFGIVTPLIIGYFGIKAWVTEEAIWFGSRQSDMIVRGATARGLAIVYTSVATFFHFRWCWGLIPVYRVYHFGMILSLLGILSGMGYAFYAAFR